MYFYNVFFTICMSGMVFYDVFLTFVIKKKSFGTMFLTELIISYVFLEVILQKVRVFSSGEPRGTQGHLQPEPATDPTKIPN